MLAVAGIFEYSMFMVRLFSLVLYKNQPAVVTAINDGKYTIEYCAKFPVPGGKPAVYEQQKVRDKDIATLYEAVPVKTEQLPEILTSKLPDKDLAVQELYELIDSDVQTSTQPVSFVDLCGFAGIDSATGTWNLYTAISSSVYFTTVSDSGCNQLLFKIRSRHEIQQILDKQAAKNREQEIRASFIDRLKLFVHRFRYDPSLLTYYTEDELKEAEKFINRYRDKLLTFNNIKFFIDDYLIRLDELNFVESIQDLYLVLALIIAKESSLRLEEVERIYNLLSKQELSINSPLVSVALKSIRL